MNFTAHSHCLDIAKHCAPLHIIVEHFHFMTALKGGEGGGKEEIVPVNCNVCGIQLQGRLVKSNRSLTFLCSTHLMTNND